MKKIVSTLIALMMVLVCFAGCSSTPAADSDSSAPAADSTAASEDAASGDAIKDGVLAPLTGSVAEYGVAVANGIKMYVEEFNAAGGINGKQIQLIEYDEEGDSAKAVTGYNSLVDQGVTAIIGHQTEYPIAVERPRFGHRITVGCHRANEHTTRSEQFLVQNAQRITERIGKRTAVATTEKADLFPCQILFFECFHECIPVILQVTGTPCRRTEQQEVVSFHRIGGHIGYVVYIGGPYPQFCRNLIGQRLGIAGRTAIKNACHSCTFLDL